MYCLYASLLAGKQALSYYFIDQLHEFLDAVLEWYNSHDRAEITPFLKKYGERLKARVQVCFCWILRYLSLRINLDLLSCWFP